MERPIRPVDWELIERYLAGDLRGEERTRAESSLREHPQLREMLAVVERRLGCADDTAPRDVEQAYAILAARLRLERDKAGAADVEVLRDQQGQKRGPRGWFWTSEAQTLRYGLASAALVLIGMIVYRHPTQNTNSGTTKYYATGAGQIAKIRLSDGSRIILAPRTRLTITTPGANDSWSVALIGEAQFQVESHPHTPFEVRTDNVVARVLGTTFDVQNYPSDRAGQVTVFEGKVSVSQIHRKAIVTLTAGMHAKFDDSIITTTEAASATAYRDWTHGRLVFQDASVPTVLETLEHWYGITFRIADSALTREHLTAAFEIGERSRMLQLLEQVLDVDMVVRDSVVTLRPNRKTHVPGSPQHRSNMHEEFFPSTEVGR